MFDPKITKKKKKKKTGFDLDSAIADASNDATENSKPDKENMEIDAAAPEDEESLDLENFGKKKRKKKKFNLEELDAALPETKKEVRSPDHCLTINLILSFKFVLTHVLFYFRMLQNRKQKNRRSRTLTCPWTSRRI